MSDTLPHNSDIERTILGSMLFEAEAIEAAISEGLEPAHFYSPVYGSLYGVMVDMFNANKAVDQLLFEEELTRRKMIPKVCSAADIAGLVTELTGASNIRAHCRILLEKAVLRNLISMSKAASSKCVEHGANPLEILGSVQQQCMNMALIGRQDTHRSIWDIMHAANNWLREKGNKTGPMGIPCGIKSLDKYIDGFQGGKLYIIAGKTSQGKSALAMNFALTAAKDGHPVGLLSLEMEDLEIGVRMIQKETRRDLSDIQYNRLTPTEWEQVLESEARIARLPLHIYETPGISITKVGAKIKRMQREDGVSLVIIDYLQLMEGKQAAKSREQEVASVSRGLKQIALSLNIPIIALSQFSRKVDENPAKRPELFALRESGALEQDCDTAIFIFDATPEEKEKYPLTRFSGGRENVRELIIRKNRGGKLGTVLAVWNDAHLSFYDMEY